jgi:hypothetical protein
VDEGLEDDAVNAGAPGADRPAAGSSASANEAAGADGPSGAGPGEDDVTGAGHGVGPGGRPPTTRVEPRTVARVLAGCALLAALTTIGLAFADPVPSRHVHGLLVTADLVCLVGVGTAWLRVVLAVGTARAPERIE